MPLLTWNPGIAAALIGLIGVLSAAIISAIIAGTYQLVRPKNGNGKAGAVKPEDVRAGDMATSWWLQQALGYGTKVDITNTRLDGLASRVERLATVIEVGLADILAQLKQRGTPL